MESTAHLDYYVLPGDYMAIRDGELVIEAHGHCGCVSHIFGLAMKPGEMRRLQRLLANHLAKLNGKEVAPK